MPELSMRNPWVFTTVTTVAWVLVWGAIQLLLFDGGLFEAVLQAGLAGIAFSVLYLYLQ
ncbi:hypothetical protein NDI56_01000 [Haloarcula sp. S1CR25-12]|uniref:Uncharacterized protein n=1 Tax=Haloarcula saliterrae TaxID=2950534 RepID=A0ABU2F804_9EURY|nr:hypothetical protein [Haloarcula sp. S1CR25-12]MDS0257980.1 hypothetical protein [Haloarcula sp. S1CR25-12]